MSVLNITIKATDSASGVLSGLNANFDELNTKAAASLGAVGDKMKSIGGAATLGLTLPIVAVGTAIVGMASDLGETTSKIGVLFGNSATDMLSWSETSAKAMGMSKQQALDAAATFATFGKSAGLSGDALVDFSSKQVQLASDLASFNNTSPEQAIQAIGAALRGESEPLRAYGVLLDDASMRNEALKLGLIATTKDALTPQQKVLAAQSLILQQTTAAQGDFARTSDGLANQQRILTARLKDTGTELGAKLLPVALKLVEMVSGLVDRFSSLSSGTQGWIVKIGLLLAAIGPILTVLGTFASGISVVTGLIAGVGGISAVVGGLGAALAVLTGPIALVVGAVALMATAWARDWGGIRSKTTEALSGMWDGLKGFASDYMSWSQDMGKRVRDWFGGLDWGGLARSAIDGIVQVFFDGPSRVFEALRHMFGGAFDRIKDFLGIHSPSAYAAREIGLPIAAGIGAGIQSGMPSVMRSVTTNNYFSIGLVGGASAGQDVMGTVQLMSALYG